MRKAKDRIPATIIGGFLGAGKTTLLNRILQSDLPLKAAVLVNDFGSINIDAQLIKSNNGKVMNLANGCICCSISGDLMGQIDSLLNLPEPPHCLLIEASGVSDPGRIAGVLNYKLFRERVRVDAVLTLVDAEQFAIAAAEFPELARVQLQTADIVVINKTDLCSDIQLEAIRRDWLPTDSTVFETCFADVPMPLLLGVYANRKIPLEACGDSPCQPGHHHPGHDEVFESVSWRCTNALDLNSLKVAIEKLPPEIYRAKGIFSVGGSPQRNAVLQKVGSRTEWSWLESPSPKKIQSELILIGKKGHLDPEEIKRDLNTGLCS